MESILQVKESTIGRSDLENNLSIAESYKNVEYPRKKCIHHLFEEQARKTPDNIAVTLDDVKLTYRELDEKSNQLAHHLRSKGVKPETLVALYLDRSLEIVIAILSILKAGGAYIPVDPEYPEERVAFMLKDSQCPAIITRRSFQAILPETSAQVIYYDEDLPEIAEEPTSKVDVKVKPDNLAYVIYTSGSTGKPKGALIEHRNVVRLLFNSHFQFDFDENDTWTIFHSFCFDFSVWEMYGALLYGGKVVIIPKDVSMDSQLYAQTLLKEKVTIINQTPSDFYNLIPKMLKMKGEAFCVRYVIFGGEKLNPTKLASIKSDFPDIKFINMYGITETTVHVTYKEITKDDIQAGFSNIGKPIPTLTAYIFDENMNLAPIGVEGELCIGGDGVSRGYLNRNELTQEKFIQNPINPEEKIYRSGDFACMRENGDLEYSGRMDTQIQLRGFRIELGEVESAIIEIEDIEECVVVLHEDSNGDKRLIAYVIFSQNEVTAEKIREHISKRLPEYMIPSFFIKIDRIPLTANGKLDDKKLPEPDFNAAPETDHITPRNETEQSLLKIWAEVLGIDEQMIGMEHNFFEIGGHSLAAATVTQHIRNEFKKTLTIRHIFENPTIAQLSAVISKSESQKKPSRKTKTKKNSKPGTYPLLNSQFLNWMFECNRKVKTNNVNAAYVIEGPLDIEGLEQAFNEVAKRHETLWYPFSLKKPMVHIEKPGRCRIKRVDLSNKNTLQQQLDLNELADSIFHRPFDLSRAPHFRAALVKQEKARHLLMTGFPHIVSDYASINDFVAEVLSVYRSDGKKGATARQWQRTSAIDMVDNEKAYLSSNEYKKGLKFWKKKLKNLGILKIDKKYLLPKDKKSGKKLLAKIQFDASIANRLKEVTAKTNAPEQIIVLALTKATLHSLTGQNDISMSMIFDSRAVYDKPPVIDMNVMSSVIRYQFTENTTYAELLNSLKWYVIDAHNYRRFPITVALHSASGFSRRIFMPIAARIGVLYLSWRYRKARVNKKVLYALVSYFIGSVLTGIFSKVMNLEKDNLAVIPGIVYNVLPNFYGNKVLWNDDQLTVTDLRDQEFIMNPRVFEENSEYQDSKILNVELSRDADNEMVLHFYGGGFSEDGFSQMKYAFLKHLEALLDNPDNPLYV